MAGFKRMASPKKNTSKRGIPQRNPVLGAAVVAEALREVRKRPGEVDEITGPLSKLESLELLAKFARDGRVSIRLRIAAIEVSARLQGFYEPEKVEVKGGFWEFSQSAPVAPELGAGDGS